MKKKVLIIIESSVRPGRAQLIGMLRGINAACLDWELNAVLSRKKISAATVKRALDGSTDGVIITNPVRKGFPERLVQAGKPTVFLDVVSEQDGFAAKTSACLNIDNAAIGKTAAAHFLSLGNYRSFAFVHDSRNEIWTHERHAAFAKALTDAGCSCKSFMADTAMNETSRKVALAGFLSSLQPPAAVMAACDLVAADVLDACRTVQLAVPEHVAVLGVDNDMMICNSQSPRLSSIEPDFEDEGFRAVAALAKLFGNASLFDSPPPVDVRVTERGSTKPLPPATRLVERALDFIKANYRNRITAKDVAMHLGVSRRLVDMRFRQLQHESILTAITRLRLDMLCGLLKEERGKLKDLAAACGFRSVIRAAHLFKERYGVSMTSYRNRHA